MDYSSKRICIAGGSGFLGSYLKSYLDTIGYQVEILPRTIYQNDPLALAKLINDSFAVINLAGASIAKRWTDSYMIELLDSRIRSTKTIVEAIKNTSKKPKLFISASATGIYRDSDRIHDESSTDFADDFLGDLSKSWEEEAQKASTETRVAIMRFAVILGKGGGMIKKLRPLFKLMLGGRIGNGKQYFPFIHIHDLARSIEFIMNKSDSEGVYNIVAPDLIDNRSFTRTFAKACKRIAIFIIPSFMVKFVFGKGASPLLNGQRVKPGRLIAEGFEFQYPDIQKALTDICK